MYSRGLDRPLLAVTFALLVAGLLTLYSAGQTDVPSAAAELWRRQLVMLGIGVVAAAFVFRVSPRLMEWAAPFLYLTGIGLLVVTLLAGTGSGSSRWIAVGGIRLGQPVEIVKLTTILMLARHLAGRRMPPNTLVEVIPSCVIIGVPFVLVALQPDLGSAIVFLGILFAMLFWVGVKPWLLLLLASPVISLMTAFSTLSWGIWIVALTILLIWIRPYVLEGVGVWLLNVGMGIMALNLWNRLAPYQQNRLVSFLNPEIDPRATGWHMIQSKVAIGSGGLFGKGFTEGTQKRLAFLPEQATDFIYSVVGEEFGFVGILLTLILFGAFLFVLVRIAMRANDPFACLAVFGIAGVMFTHVFENAGMTVGIMPITGIPLPFFSYGGSFLVVCCIAVAIAMRVSWESRIGGYADTG